MFKNTKKNVIITVWYISWVSRMNEWVIHVYRISRYLQIEIELLVSLDIWTWTFGTCHLGTCIYKLGLSPTTFRIAQDHPTGITWFTYHVIGITWLDQRPRPLILWLVIWKWNIFRQLELFLSFEFKRKTKC